MTGFLDGLSPQVRHLVFALVASLLTAGIAYEKANEATLLGHIPGALVPVVGSVVTLLVAYVTPFTRQYGVGGLESGGFPDTPGDDETDGADYA